MCIYKIKIGLFLTFKGVSLVEERAILFFPGNDKKCLPKRAGFIFPGQHYYYYYLFFLFYQTLSVNGIEQKGQDT